MLIMPRKDDLKIVRNAWEPKIVEIVTTHMQTQKVSLEICREVVKKLYISRPVQIMNPRILIHQLLMPV